ncbi:MAG: hypothetical protein N3C12_01105 [Candidatus Binatia bacterium]|nr:hypothetical protein [Candidatus Binatia bacterium]
MAQDCPAPIPVCAGDCNTDAEVTIEELIAGVLIALGSSSLSRCAPMDRDGNGEVTIDELVVGAGSALQGCPLEAGGIYEVQVCGDERFRVHIQDSETLELAERILAGKEQPKIVTGELRCGHGNFNGPWSWHLDPATVGFADIAIELCDACPSFVEEELDYWLHTVARYCPWTAEIVRRVR